MEGEDVVRAQRAEHLGGGLVEPLRREERSLVPLGTQWRARLRVHHGRLGDADEKGGRVGTDGLDAAEEPEEDLQQVAQPPAAVGAQRVVVDHHHHHGARRCRHRVPHVGRIRDVDLKAAVVEEPGAVREGKPRAERAGRVLYLR